MAKIAQPQSAYNVARSEEEAATWTWIEQRKNGLTSDDLEDRRNLLGLVNRLTFSNMDTICALMLEGMKDPYLLSEAVELVFYQGANSGWMSLFAHFCGRLVEASPLYGRHGEINFKALLLHKYRTEFEEAVYVPVPSLVQLSAQQVGLVVDDDQQQLLPQELSSYVRERSWAAAASKAREQRWRRMNELVLLLGEFYNADLVGRGPVLTLLRQLARSIDTGVCHHNIEPLCRLLATVGAKLVADRRPQVHHHHHHHHGDDQERQLRPAFGDECEDLVPTGLWEPRQDHQAKYNQEEEEDNKEEEGKKVIERYLSKVTTTYLLRVVEWQLGARLRFMMHDLVDLHARSWHESVPSWASSRRTASA